VQEFFNAGVKHSYVVGTCPRCGVDFFLEQAMATHGQCPKHTPLRREVQHQWTVRLVDGRAALEIYNVNLAAALKAKELEDAAVAARRSASGRGPSRVSTGEVAPSPALSGGSGKSSKSVSFTLSPDSNFNCGHNMDFSLLNEFRGDLRVN
jgi:hypothetical protein